MILSHSKIKLYTHCTSESSIPLHLVYFRQNRLAVIQIWHIRYLCGYWRDFTTQMSKMQYKHQEHIIHYHIAHAKYNVFFGPVLYYCTYVMQYHSCNVLNFLLLGILMPPVFPNMHASYLHDAMVWCNLIYLQHILRIIQLWLTLWLMLSPYHGTIISTNRYFLPLSRTVRVHVCPYWFQPCHIVIVNFSIQFPP